MTEQNEAESHTETPEDTPEGGNTAERKPPREQRYRLERNEAREERDAARAKIESLQTRQLHNLAGELLAQPEDIGLAGKELSEFLDEDGWLDPEAVTAAAEAVIEGRPGLAKNPVVSVVDYTQGTGGKVDKTKPEWADLFRNKGFER